MFKASQTIQYITLDDIVHSGTQEQLFAKYIGIWPDLSKSYHSIFRTDKRPGCRFKWHNGLLWFIDNAGYNNKLAFNIIDVVMFLNRCSFKEALHIIAKDNNIEKRIVLENRVKQDVEIRFEHRTWKANIFNLSNDILHNENVYNVTRYWVRMNGEWKMYNKECIAYYFPLSGHVKLYFIDSTIFRWFTNCDNDDIYGVDKLQEYYERNPDIIVITKSQKDRLVLDYHYGINCIALQNEASFINRDTLDMLAMFKKKIILFDNDKTGIDRSNLLCNMYGYDRFEFSNYKDAYENYINNNHIEINNLKL